MKRKIICVTGPMAAGKNLVSSILEKKGFLTVDADILVHTAIENSRDLILKTFGTLADDLKINLLTQENKINRRALGKLIFSKPDLIKKQEDIVYPEVDRLIKNFIEQNKESSIAINATLLYKISSFNFVEHVLYVDCPKIIRFFRAKKRDLMKSKQILERFRAQKNLFAKYKNSNADTVRVWNVGSRKSLEKKIDAFISRCR